MPSNPESKSVYILIDDESRQKFKAVAKSRRMSLKRLMYELANDLPDAKPKPTAPPAIDPTDSFFTLPDRHVFVTATPAVRQAIESYAQRDPALDYTYAKLYTGNKTKRNPTGQDTLRQVRSRLIARPVDSPNPPRQVNMTEVQSNIPSLQKAWRYMLHLCYDRIVPTAIGTHAYTRAFATQVHDPWLDFNNFVLDAMPLKHKAQERLFATSPSPVPPRLLMTNTQLPRDFAPSTVDWLLRNDARPHMTPPYPPRVTYLEYLFYSRRVSLATLISAILTTNNPPDSLRFNLFGYLMLYDLTQDDYFAHERPEDVQKNNRFIIAWLRTARRVIKYLTNHSTSSVPQHLFTTCPTIAQISPDAYNPTYALIDPTRAPQSATPISFNDCRKFYFTYYQPRYQNIWR